MPAEVAKSFNNAARELGPDSEAKPNSPEAISDNTMSILVTYYSKRFADSDTIAISIEGPPFNATKSTDIILRILNKKSVSEKEAWAELAQVEVKLPSFCPILSSEKSVLKRPTRAVDSMQDDAPRTLAMFGKRSLRLIGLLCFIGPGSIPSPSPWTVVRYRSATSGSF
ncbi:hypothetical protein EMCG_00446 [[Emmonsia] crescens]|uniref:Uncharacterized protein n=1 Tax=[Emmonsia] crescens TaxID=73230 RepID=A0A0G2HVM5_9EURO|nr:hypothetical protein EMCG_00446 [Emmonsia crescens UAMH 3008]